MRLQVEMVTITDRNDNAVEVEIDIPGDVPGVDPDEVPDLPEAARRPRAVGLAQHEGTAGLTGRPFVNRVIAAPVAPLTATFGA